MKKLVPPNDEDGKGSDVDVDEKKEPKPLSAAGDLEGVLLDVGVTFSDCTGLVRRGVSLVFGLRKEAVALLP